MNDFNVCPMCQSKAIRNVADRKWICDSCGFDLYNNVAAAVGLIIADDEGRILFERRAKEPRKGALALPGGFVDPDESAEGACFRECKEECGVVPVGIKYIASFPNTYVYKNITYKTCDMFFEATLPQGYKLTAQTGEVDGFEYCYVRNAGELAELDLAFDSARKTLQLWLNKKKEGK